jgi:exodeoxyribonuclease-3
MEFEDDMRAYLCGLNELKPVIYCGDLNVAHNEIDLKNPKTNIGNAGFSYEERGKMTELLDSGFTDSYRYLHPDTVKYSWWSYMFQARAKNAGWRIDYFIVSERIKEQMKDAAIRTTIEGSDHCPVVLELED